MTDDKVRIFDTTLRDGEQTPGVTVTPEQKVQVATRLDELGIDAIEAGFPIVSAGEMQAIKTIAGAGLLIAAAFAPLGAEPPTSTDPAWQALERRAAALRPAAEEVKWQQLAWIVDPNDAIALAKAEHRPIFFWAAGGRGRDGLPLERC